MNLNTPSRPVLIAGAHGFTGSRVMQSCPGAVPVPGELLRSAEQRLTDFIRAAEPQIIINAAAVSDIGACERDPETSYTANVTLPVILAGAARETGAKLISFSSDQVYTGLTESGPYREDSLLPVPANVYARHKLEAEQRVLDVNPDAVLLRATWMYDMPLYRGAVLPDGPGSAAPSPHANRGNFLITVLDAVLHGRPLSFPSRRYRGITYVRQAVSFLEQASRLPGGIYNYGSENDQNMLETAKALLQELKLEYPVQDSGQIQHNLWMDCSRIRSFGMDFDSTVQGFRRCIRDYGLRDLSV